MDRRRFLETAPSYYSLAIATHLSSSGESLAFKDSIQSAYSIEYEPADDPVDYLHLDDLFQQGAQRAIDLGLLEVIKDDFGPDLYKLPENFWENWASAKEINGSPFHKYAAAGDAQRRWLLSALLSVKKTYDSLGITSKDFLNGEAEWAPIPLERNEPELKAVIVEIDNLAEQVRGDNGYGTQHSEEKIYVLEKLRAVSKRLKDDASISWLYLREFAIEPLIILGRRYGGAAIGIAAEAAKAALKEWLKKKGIGYLDGL